MLKEEGVEDIEIFSDNIHSLCDGPCASCDSENDYFKQNPPQRNFTQKCQDCEKYKKLFLKLKELEEQCYQLKNQINFARHHQLHQIKSVETQSKTGISESLHEPLMKIAHKRLISDKSTFEQLTPSEQTLWTRFKTDDIYRFLTGEPDTVPEFQYNWTSIPATGTNNQRPSSSYCSSSSCASSTTSAAWTSSSTTATGTNNQHPSSSYCSSSSCASITTSAAWTSSSTTATGRPQFK
jgi:hypothetical protein